MPRPQGHGEGWMKSLSKLWQAPPIAWKGCQWIDGEPDHTDACKCMAPRSGGTPYCAAHAKRCYGHVPDPLSLTLASNAPMFRRKVGPSAAPVTAIRNQPHTPVNAALAVTDDEKRIVRLWNAGTSAGDIARAIGRSKGVVAGCLHRIRRRTIAAAKRRAAA